MSLAKHPLIVVFSCSISMLALANCSDSDGTSEPSAGSGGKSGAASQAGGGGKAGATAKAGAGGALTPAGGSEEAGAPDSGGSMSGGAAGEAPGGGGEDAGGKVGTAGGGGVAGSAGGGGASPGAGAGGVAGVGGTGGQQGGPHQAPILKYNFDEGTGLTVADSSGSGFNASLSVSAWTAQGRHGAALAMIGGVPPTGFVSVPPGIFKGVQETTIASWVKLTVDTPWSRIFDFGGKGVGTDTRFMYLAPNTPDGTTFSVFGGVPITREAVVKTGTFLPLTVWKHLAVTAAANGKHAIYIDGFPAAESTSFIIPPSELEPMAADSWLGKSRFPDPGLNGALDEFTIYDRVLSPAEIATLAAPKADYARLPFDEATGTTSADTSDRAVNATLNGATWASGRLGAAVALSGVNQYVTLNNPLAGCTDQLTIAVWVKEVVAKPWARIFDFGGTSDNFMFLTPSTDEGKMRLSIHTSLTETVVLSNTTVPADSTWHHVAVVINPAAATIFVDGVPTATTLLPVIPSVFGATNEHWLGKSRFTATDPYFNGSFDELRISCRAYTPDEIKNLAFH